MPAGRIVAKSEAVPVFTAEVRDQLGTALAGYAPLSRKAVAVRRRKAIILRFDYKLQI